LPARGGDHGLDEVVGKRHPAEPQHGRQALAGGPEVGHPLRVETLRAAEVFSERELGQVIAMAVTINAWNRINVATRLPARR
jgi:alkylhydroperoxidase family enzyme